MVHFCSFENPSWLITECSVVLCDWSFKNVWKSLKGAAETWLLSENPGQPARWAKKGILHSVIDIECDLHFQARWMWPITWLQSEYKVWDQGSACVHSGNMNQSNSCGAEPTHWQGSSQGLRDKLWIKRGAGGEVSRWEVEGEEGKGGSGDSKMLPSLKL